MAYTHWKSHGFKTSRIQHRAHTTHGKTLRACERKLRKKGYVVITEQNAIARYVKDLGGSGNPDILAIRKSIFSQLDSAIFISVFSGRSVQQELHQRKDDIIAVEIVENGKQQGFLMNQIARYANIGTLAIVFPIDTKKIIFWGLQDLNK